MLKSAIVVSVVVVLNGHRAALATPPAAPVVNEPQVDDQVVNAADVHMETSAFFDVDDDGHQCTDWQIWTVSPAELVWDTACITGPARVHTHLGDGVFLGSHAGRDDLLPETSYFMRVRHIDDSGLPDAASAWAVRTFSTSPLTQLNGLEIEDVADVPEPNWSDITGAPVVLDGGPSPATLRVESGAGLLFLAYAGLDSISNAVNNPPPLDSHEPIAVRVTAGLSGAGLVFSETNLTFTTDDGDTVTVYIPAQNLVPGETTRLWVAETGATYAALSGQTEPDFSTLVRSAPTPWIARQPGYVIERVATGFQLPVNIAFVPSPGPNPTDPLFYVTELYGQIKVVLNNGEVETYASGLLNFNPTGNFPGTGEQGLAGIAIDPATGDVFAGYMHDDGGNVHHPRVARFTSADGGHSAAVQTVILDMAGESQGQSHFISNFTFGPDGKLYVHLGDGFDASTGQNTNSFRGKVLRLNTDGSAPADNVFYDAGNGINARDYTYAYGLRNPFGGAWRASNSRHYQVENGPSVDRFNAIQEGVNYLWDGSDASMYNFAIYNWAPANAPVNIAFIQPETFGGSAFPVDKYDHAFVTESGPTFAGGPQSRGKRISEFVIDANDNLISGPTPLIEYVGPGRATACGLAAGPDGLYFTDLYKDLDSTSPIDAGASVLRVRFVGTASFALNQARGPVPHQVGFTNTSTVPGVSSVEWTFGDGGTSSQSSPTHTYTEAGLYTVRLSVIGANGAAISQSERAVRVGPTKSVAFITGFSPLSATDAAVRDHLGSFGLTVTTFLDDPASRPAAFTIAAAHDLVVISSTITSGNVAGDFDQLPVPLVFWEQAIGGGDRMSLASGGETVVSSGDYTVLNATHPITQGYAIGNVATLQDDTRSSFLVGPFAPGATSLLRLPSDSNARGLITAEAGSTLLDGQTAPARRAFIFLEDVTFSTLNANGRDLFNRTIAWALGIGAPLITLQPEDVTTDEHTPASIPAQTSSPIPAEHQWARDGGSIPNTGTATLFLADVHDEDSGVYVLTATNLYGSTSSDPALLIIEHCHADLNGDGILDNGDIGIFVQFFLAGDLATDFNGDGILDNGDIGAFVTAFLTGCP